MFLTKLRSIISTKRAWLLPLGALLVLTLWKYHGRPRFEFIPNDVAVTIPEGTNLADIDRLVSVAGIAAPHTLLTPTYLASEGTLFPDTYRFNRGSSAKEILARFEENFAKKCDASCAKALILASILEKEVRTRDDMRVVAGIIGKRLIAGMALQIDATVAYGVCYQEFINGTYCDVSQVNIVDNIHRDSAYNTYTRAGLPAGPISNPGLVALDAALHPESSDYWYYLSAKDGATIFSRTLAEHNRAKAKYLR